MLCFHFSPSLFLKKKSCIKKLQICADRHTMYKDVILIIIKTQYAEYIMRNSGLEEAQVGIKIARRSINNLRYTDDTILIAESEEELKNLLMKVKEENKKSWLKAQHSEN